MTDNLTTREQPDRGKINMTKSMRFVIGRSTPTFRRKNCRRPSRKSEIQPPPSQGIGGGLKAWGMLAISGAKAPTLLSRGSLQAGERGSGAAGLQDPPLQEIYRLQGALGVSQTCSQRSKFEQISRRQGTSLVISRRAGGSLREREPELDHNEGHRLYVTGVLHRQCIDYRDLQDGGLARTFLMKRNAPWTPDDDSRLLELQCAVESAVPSHLKLVRVPRRRERDEHLLMDGRDVWNKRG